MEMAKAKAMMIHMFSVLYVTGASPNSLRAIANTRRSMRRIF